MPVKKSACKNNVAKKDFLLAFLVFFITLKVMLWSSCEIQTHAVSDTVELLMMVPKKKRGIQPT